MSLGCPGCAGEPMFSVSTRGSGTGRSRCPISPATSARGCSRFSSHSNRSRRRRITAEPGPMPDPRVTFRPIAPDDMDFLLRVYRSTREEELAMVVDWTAEQKDAFVRHPFHAEDSSSRDHNEGPQVEVVLTDGVPAGPLYVHRRNREIRLV